jgi:hypothetical protein
MSWLRAKRLARYFAVLISSMSFFKSSFTKTTNIHSFFRGAGEALIFA